MLNRNQDIPSVNQCELGAVLIAESKQNSL